MLEIQYKKIDELIPYANNSRTHSESQVNQIASSIKEFGFNNPILLDGDNGIIAGHGRLAAAQKLGLDEVPTIDLEHLTPAQRKAYIIADNKLALNADWDFELLPLELQALQEGDFDLKLLGFSEDELKDLLGDAEIIGMPNLSNEENPELQQMAFILHNSQADTVKRAMALVKADFDIVSDLNSNQNGNALAMICELFITQNENS